MAKLGERSSGERLVKMFRFQLRLVLSCLGGVLLALFVTPYVLPLLHIGNLVVAGILGALLYLLVAIVGGLIWRRSIMASPVRWGLAAPPVIAVTIYLGLRLVGGFDRSEAQLAADASLVAGFCASFASAIFHLWTHLAPVEHDRPV